MTCYACADRGRLWSDCDACFGRGYTYDWWRRVPQKFTVLAWRRDSTNKPHLKLVVAHG